MKILSNTFYNLNDKEVSRYTNNSKSSIHIVNKDSYITENKYFSKVLPVDATSKNPLSSIINSESYDLVVLTDIVEVTGNIYNLLINSSKLLNPHGKIVITSINPRWNFLISILESLKIKKSSSLKSVIYPKKIKGTLEACGLEIQNSYNRQILPFRLYGLGSMVNRLLEVILCPLGLGLKTYFICQPKKSYSNNFSKSLIVPAKNEEKNLPILFKEIEQLNIPLEIVLIYGDSKDDTEKMCYKIEEQYSTNTDISVSVAKQKGKGKANAVFEALELTSNEVIAILDSDISVEPFELANFYKIIDSGVGDFVNGSRLISGLESGSMRFLNILGNKFFQFIINLIIAQNISDSLCGTKVFKRENIEIIKNWQKKVGFKDPFGDFDLLMSSAYSGLKIVEYPIYYRTRIYGKTQISRFRDGFKLIIYITKSFFLFKTSL